MKKRLLILLYVLLSLVFAKMLLNFFYNRYMMEAYDNKDYSVNDNILLVGNVDEPYIAHYNNGNVYYQQGCYEEAIEEYDKALESFPPRMRECSIRINKALAMVATLGEDMNLVDMTDINSVDEAIDLLYDAIEVLTEDGCASDDGDGHNATAQRLKEEIEDMIKKLEEEKTKPTPTPTPTPTPSPTPSPTPTPTPDPNVTPTPTPDPNATPTPTPTSDPNATPTPTPDPNATPTPTPDPNATPTPTPDPNGTPTPTPEMSPEEQKQQEIENQIADMLEESSDTRSDDLQEYSEWSHGINGGYDDDNIW